MKEIRGIGATIILLLTMLACSLGGSALPSETPPPGEKIDQTTPEAATVTEAPTDPPTETAGACDNAYMPVVVGATWDYKLTGPTSDTFTHTVLSVEDDGFTEQDVFAVGVTRQGTWACEDGNLIALDPPSGSSGTVQAEGVQVNLETKDVSGITLPATINAGDTWSQTLTLEGAETINGQEYPALNELTSDCTAIGVESVTVEAGTFDAMKVECQTAMNLTITIGGSDMNTPLNLAGTNWYAENVGLIKNVTTGMGLDSTTELVSYTIPQ
jgi:hypothetical protein